MEAKDIGKFSRKEIADRTFQRRVYRTLVDFQGAIWDCKKQGAALGEIGELETQRMIDNLCELADIGYRSKAERRDYEKPELPSVGSVVNLPIIDVNDDGIDV